MEYAIKIVGCAVLALSCVAVPMLTVLSVVYQWGGFVCSCLSIVSIVIACGIFVALMNVKSEGA